MKRLLALILCLLMAFCFIGCGPTEEEKLESEKQSLADFEKHLTSADIVAVNARVETLIDGSKFLLADIENKSDKEVKDPVVTFAVWDETGVTAAIKTQDNPTNYENVMEVTLAGKTVPANSTWTATAGLKLAEESYNIAYVTAIARSCDKGGEKWNNELYDAWKENYRGIPLKPFQLEEMKSFIEKTDEK